MISMTMVIVANLKGFNKRTTILPEFYSTSKVPVPAVKGAGMTRFFFYKSDKCSALSARAQRCTPNCIREKKYYITDSKPFARRVKNIFPHFSFFSHFKTPQEPNTFNQNMSMWLCRHIGKFRFNEDNILYLRGNISLSHEIEYF